MVKTMIENSAYEPCIRSYRWLKLKRDYLEQSLSDSLDLVVVAAKYGEGKRTGVYGTFLLACYNCESERYETTGMCATGFSDEDLKVYAELLKPLVLKEPHSEVYCKEGTGARAVYFYYQDGRLVYSEDSLRDLGNRHPDLPGVHVRIRSLPRVKGSRPPIPTSH